MTPTLGRTETIKHICEWFIKIVAVLGPAYLWGRFLPIFPRSFWQVVLYVLANAGFIYFLLRVADKLSLYVVARLFRRH